MTGRSRYALPASFTPKAFEGIVADYLRYMGGLSTGETPRLVVKQREVLGSPDGDFEIDVTVRFRTLALTFLMLVECKHHRAPLKREHVQALHSKLLAVGAHKAVVFCTSGFQRGAIAFASRHGIALVHCKPGEEPVTIIAGEGDDDDSEAHIPVIDEWENWVFYWGGGTLYPTAIEAAHALTIERSA